MAFLKIRQCDLSSNSLIFNFLDIYPVYSRYLKKFCMFLKSEEEAPYADIPYKKIWLKWQSRYVVLTKDVKQKDSKDYNLIAHHKVVSATAGNNEPHWSLRPNSQATQWHNRFNVGYVNINTKTPQISGFFLMSFCSCCYKTESNNKVYLNCKINLIY